MGQEAQEKSVINGKPMSPPASASTRAVTQGEERWQEDREKLSFIPVIALAYHTLRLSPAKACPVQGQFLSLIHI